MLARLHPATVCLAFDTSICRRPLKHQGHWIQDLKKALGLELEDPEKP